MSSAPISLVADLWPILVAIAGAGATVVGVVWKAFSTCQTRSREDAKEYRQDIREHQNLLLEIQRNTLTGTAANTEAINRMADILERTGRQQQHPPN